MSRGVPGTFPFRVQVDDPRDVAEIFNGQAVQPGDQVVAFRGVINVGHEVSVAVDQDGEDAGELLFGDAHGLPNALLTLLERQDR